MNTKDVILSRRSIRKFDPTKPVTEEHIHAMLEAAMHAPSACNTRPWDFVVITDPEDIKKVGEFEGGQRSYGTAQAVIIVLASEERGKVCEGNLLNDCGAAAENLILQAWDMGIGSCWCGIYPVDTRMAGAREFLGLPDDVIPFCAIPLGFPAENPEVRGFYDENLVHYGKW